MSAQPNVCPVCGCYEPSKYFEDRFDCGGLSDGSECHYAPDLAIVRAKRIAHLEAALTQIKDLDDDPRLAVSGLGTAIAAAENALKETP